MPRNRGEICTIRRWDARQIKALAGYREKFEVVASPSW